MIPGLDSGLQLFSSTTSVSRNMKVSSPKDRRVTIDAGFPQSLVECPEHSRDFSVEPLPWEARYVTPKTRIIHDLGLYFQTLLKVYQILSRC